MRTFTAINRCTLRDADIPLEVSRHAAIAAKSAVREAGGINLDDHYAKITVELKMRYAEESKRPDDSAILKIIETTIHEKYESNVDVGIGGAWLAGCFNLEEMSAAVLKALKDAGV